MKILALDLGKFNSVSCIFDSATRKSRFATIATEREQLARLFRKCKADLIVMEACGPNQRPGSVLRHGNDLAQQDHGKTRYVALKNVPRPR